MVLHEGRVHKVNISTQMTLGLALGLVLTNRMWVEVTCVYYEKF